jgi:hypothetical protein
MRLSLNCIKQSRWFARFGAAAFAFFLIKGLLWLIVPAVIAWWSLK